MTIQAPPVARLAEDQPLPYGWTLAEVQQNRLREAVRAWQDNTSRALYLDRGVQLCRAAEALLAELDRDRRLRHEDPS